MMHASAANNDRRQSAFGALDAKLHSSDQLADVPRADSFKAFLRDDARVKTKDGSAPYSFTGREAIEGIVDRIDLILGSETGKPLKDASLAVCGGAQWGKSVLGLNFTAYMTGLKYRNVGYYLPDDDLVQGVVDGKFRPEVLDLLPWYARQISVGKTVNESGKAVNRKGAFLVSRPGGSPGLGMFIGLNKKVPTTFTMDAVIQDEKDDIKAARAKFLRGRMTSSDLRFSLVIGTQRIAGAGQNAEFEAGTQEVWELIDPVIADGFCPEEHWPQICRVALDGTPKPDDPQLGWEGVFKRPGSDEVIATFDPEAHYYLANPLTGTPLDRKHGRWVCRRPDRMKERKFSMRVSQFGIEAIDLVQIVAHWRDAVADPEQMIVFACDRQAMPRSTLQQLDQAILDRARTTERFPLSLAGLGEAPCYGGLDTGDRCWFTVRESASPVVKRLRYAEQIALGRVKARAVELFHRCHLSCLFIDARPAAQEARHITWAVHNLLDYAWPKIDEPEKAYIQFPGDLAWDGPSGKWKGLRAAVVEFALKDGQGVRHKLGITQEGKFYPIIQCNRDESIQGVINELLTIKEGLVHVVDGKSRELPILRLPFTGTGAAPAAELLSQHFLAGSKKDRHETTAEEHFVDKIENHYLLSATYARLAESIGCSAIAAPFVYERVEPASSTSAL
ncbi:hypothetical protein K0B96_06595 [Horticoccus luteus]|uniref:Uncharacterized protein n=1 Tax=Horticoccus luteus TaxID=2862869 RepID=A0A8F9TXZ3_9BACT|nr:hypothetical protein [Horticoccus luteus]QYM80278.1 hypothetical protein K0B96_06595 [Horticoccus luteus]